MKTELSAVGLVLLASFIGSFGALMIKKGSAKATWNPIALVKNYYLLLGGFCYVCGTLLFIPALSHGDLSVLYPFSSTSYIWVSLFSLFFLHEKMNKEKWIGVALIIVGVTLIGFG